LNIALYVIAAYLVQRQLHSIAAVVRKAATPPGQPAPKPKREITPGVWAAAAVVAIAIEAAIIVVIVLAGIQAS
jgi:hypothetical protein